MAEIHLYDSLGNELKYLTQWDTNQTMVIEGAQISPEPVVHFGNMDTGTALTVTPEVHDNKIIVKIPNLLLRQRFEIYAYLYYELEDDSWRTLYKIRIPIEPRPRPSGYEYSDDDYTDSSGLVARMTQLEQDVADLKYVPIAFESANAAPPIMELGNATDGVLIEFRLNKEPESLTLDGKTITVKDLYSGDMLHGLILLEGLAVSERTEFKLRATDERDKVVTKTPTINFYNGVYYGAIDDGIDIDSSVVLTLEKSVQSTRTITFTVTTTSPQRVIFALPSSGYGTPKFTIGGFEYAWEKVAIFDFENYYGHIESYDVWMHGQLVTGNITVSVS